MINLTDEFLMGGGEEYLNSGRGCWLDSAVTIYSLKSNISKWKAENILGSIPRITFSHEGGVRRTHLLV